LVGIEKTYKQQSREIAKFSASSNEKAIHAFADHEIEWAKEIMRRVELCIRHKNPNNAPITMKEQRELLSAWVQCKNKCDSANTARALQLVAVAKDSPVSEREFRDKRIEITKFLAESYSDAIKALADRKLEWAKEIMRRVELCIRLKNKNEPFTMKEQLDMTEAFILYKNKCDSANTERSLQLLTVAEELADKMKALL
jgi:hypothetical protein